MDPETKNELLRRFETLLDVAFTAEGPPPGLDAELMQAVAGEAPAHDRVADEAPAHKSVDAWGLWSAMTALTQEVRLQGRAFQELNRTLVEQPAKVADELRAVYAERERAAQRDAERRCRREALGVLVDLRDRLGRGLEAVSAGENRLAAESSRWLTRLLSPGPAAANETLHALIRGYELGLERVDQALGEWNACEIRCQGEAFDPRRMNAVEVAESDQVPAGTVLEVYRSGYEWVGEVYRPAQVKVSRAPTHPEPKHPESKRPEGEKES